jgi:hypothetical protein
MGARPASPVRRQLPTDLFLHLAILTPLKQKIKEDKPAAVSKAK